MLCAVNKETPLIAAKGLAKTFKSPTGAIPVLNGIDFAIMPGESVSIRGESGSGKSTLLNVLSGLERGDGGQLQWKGEAVERYSLSKLAKLRTRFIGFVFQAYYVAPELNALENVLLGARIAGRLTKTARARAEALLVRVGLENRLTHNATKLSGGERQRVAVARALINDPAVVLADEPTGNLDEKTGESVMELLLELTQETGRSLVLVTHSPDFARLTQSQLFLTKGSFQ